MAWVQSHIGSLRRGPFRQSRTFHRVTVVHAVAAGNPSINASAGPPTEIVRINPQLLASGGLDPSQENSKNVAAFTEMLSKGFLPINLQHPGVRVQNIDPPVLTVTDFLTPEVCETLIASAQASGQMKQSKVGGMGDFKDDIRTSCTLAITNEVLQSSAALQAPLQQLLNAAVQLLAGLLDTSAISNMQFVRPTSPVQLTPELPQIAHYLPGQHFLSHEDGFPASIALEKGYQRRATLLVYLNDVQQGGATKFDHLSVSVQPQKGKALLFFPSFSGGRSDARTLHTAEDAADGHDKWVFQLWLCSTLPRRPPVDAAAHAAQQLATARKGSGTQPRSKKFSRKKR